MLEIGLLSIDELIVTLLPKYESVNDEAHLSFQQVLLKLLVAFWNMS